MSEFTIEDQSADRAYFTIIPNLIVNGSTGLEQALYIQLKRYAGEDGTAWPSLNTLASRLGIHKTTVSKTLDKLLRRGWIEELEPVKKQGGKVRRFAIVDLWALNTAKYEEKKCGAHVTTLTDRSGAQTDREVVLKPTRRRSIKKKEIYGATSVKDFLDFAFNMFKQKYNNPLTIDGGKDGKIIKSLLGTHDLEQLKDLWGHFLDLADSDPFIRDKAGVSIGTFKSQINKLVTRKATARNRRGVVL